MRFCKSILISIPALLFASIATCSPAQHPLGHDHPLLEGAGSHNVSVQLFAELEEFSRIVDIAYCVGVTGIYPPFKCASRCSEFPGYQLIDTWNTGPLMADSCGYIVLDHNGSGRIIVAFRGTYSVANTIVDLSTIPQEYVPYPGDPDDNHENLHDNRPPFIDRLPRPWRWLRKKISPSSKTSQASRIINDEKPDGPKCQNCTVHMGFFTSWANTRPFIIPHLRRLRDLHPTYALHLVGHSLGGAVAALAALECETKGWHPTVTTFGEPRIGNPALRTYLDELFDLPHGRPDSSAAFTGTAGRYRRITHTSDPVPLLPLTEWSFAMHAGEIYISKPDLQPSVADLRHCDGDEDMHCIYGEERGEPLPDPDPDPNPPAAAATEGGGRGGAARAQSRARWGLPARYRMWQLFFAHRDYFWRLGLCVPGGDPAGWGRGYGDVVDGDGDGDEDGDVLSMKGL